MKKTSNGAPRLLLALLFTGIIFILTAGSLPAQGMNQEPEQSLSTLKLEQRTEMTVSKTPEPPKPEWEPPLWSVIGFVLMLGAIAMIPLLKPHWWESNRNKAIITFALAIPFGIYILLNDRHSLVYEMREYISFIVLLGSLFIISGGIYLHGNIYARPKNNVILLGIGTILASLIGTTGAAMLMIRPLISTNSERKYAKHTIIFSVFLIANIGGALTPLGDPPLYMGYLRGVPFLWTLRLWQMWLPASGLVLLVYYLIDRHYWAKESIESKRWDEKYQLPLSLHGKINFLWLIAIILIIFFGIKSPYRELAMIALCLISWLTTPKGVREAHKFTFNPIIEVAVLFFGIFVTMVPALILLHHHGAGMGITRPWQFFWATGILSSFLDNTPTYLVYLSLAESLNLPPEVMLHSGSGISHIILEAIACGAVFMGANTYIGNGPNFMVKVIAEENSVKMPSFFGYMLWSGLILIPIFILITLIFFI